MVRIRVRALGTLSLLFGGGNEKELTFQRETEVRDVLNRLEEWNPRLRDVIIDPILKSHLPNALILLNGVEIGNLNKLDTPVEDGDELILLSVTHGG